MAAPEEEQQIEVGEPGAAGEVRVDRRGSRLRAGRHRLRSARQYPSCAKVHEMPKASRSAERTVAPFASRFTPMESRW